MKLDPNLAQSIVNKMMENIPYNINMMNEHGYIIASGDKKRINTLHLGAIDIIKSGKTKPLIESLGKFGQPGVNIPIEFDHKTIGVIGITGDPKKVTPLASLLKVSTELLISQLNSTKIKNQHKETLNHFLYQWIETDDVAENEELKIRARDLNIDLSIPRVAIIVETKDFNNFKIIDGDFSFRKTAQQLLIITKNNTNVSTYLAACQKSSLPIGISDKSTELKMAVLQAINCLEICRILNLNDVFYYQQISFTDQLMRSSLSSKKYLGAFKSLLKTNSGLELLETLDYYFKSNGNVTKTSTELKVHRNTTNYRLNNISEYFNLDLHNLTDMIQLYTNYLHFKKELYDHQSASN